jgi:hypothetical protein
MTEIFLIIVLILLVVSFSIVSFIEYKYIKFILNRYFSVVEGAEKTRDDLVELEKAFIEFTNNPLITMESDYRKIRRILELARQKMISFEEYYQSLPEKRESNDESES